MVIMEKIDMDIKRGSIMFAAFALSQGQSRYIC